MTQINVTFTPYVDRPSDRPSDRAKGLIAKYDIVVTRIPALVALLRERGLIDEDTPVLERVSGRYRDLITGKHVIGSPASLHVTQLAASWTELPMRTFDEPAKAKLRDGTITLDELRRLAEKPLVYQVREVYSPREPGLVWQAAYDYVEAFSPARIVATSIWRGLTVYRLGDTTQAVSAEVIPARAVWRPMSRGPWLDGLGQEVVEVEGASSWGYRLRAASGTDPARPNYETGVSGTLDLRWETVAEALSACQELGLEAEVEVVRSSEHGHEAEVLATWSPSEGARR